MICRGALFAFQFREELELLGSWRWTAVGRQVGGWEGDERIDGLNISRNKIIINSTQQRTRREQVREIKSEYCFKEFKDV